MLITTIWLSTICMFQACIHLIIVGHSLVMCYFISDSDDAYATNILLGSLALYISTSYDMISDDKTLKNYHILVSYLFQFRAGCSSPMAFEASSHYKCTRFGSWICWLWENIWQCWQREPRRREFLTEEEQDAIAFVVEERIRRRVLKRLQASVRRMRYKITIRQYIENPTDAMLNCTESPFNASRTGLDPALRKPKTADLSPTAV